MGDAQRQLLDVGKADLGPLRKVVQSRPVAQWEWAHLLECGHAYTIRGNDPHPKRMRCLECRKARQHGDEVPQ